MAFANIRIPELKIGSACFPFSRHARRPPIDLNLSHFGGRKWGVDSSAIQIYACEEISFSHEDSPNAKRTHAPQSFLATLRSECVAHEAERDHMLFTLFPPLILSHRVDTKRFYMLISLRKKKGSKVKSFGFHSRPKRVLCHITESVCTIFTRALVANGTVDS